MAQEVPVEDSAKAGGHVAGVNSNMGRSYPGDNMTGGDRAGSRRKALWQTWVSSALRLSPGHPTAGEDGTPRTGPGASAGRTGIQRCGSLSLPAPPQSPTSSAPTHASGGQSALAERSQPPPSFPGAGWALRVNVRPHCGSCRWKSGTFPGRAHAPARAARERVRLCADSREARLAAERCAGARPASGPVGRGADAPAGARRCACAVAISRVLADTPRAQLPAVLPERRPRPPSQDRPRLLAAFPSTQV